MRGGERRRREHMDANQEGRVTSKIRGRGREWGFKDAGLDRGRDESKGRRE